MITKLDLAIYRAIEQQKKLTEKYLGTTTFEWLYSEAHYTADCTVGVPFDLFDKTIVSILSIDEVLSIEEIGDILGMNIIHDPDNQQYRDQAEYDILSIALDSLYNYQMIEIGDINYSACRLTNLGREYAQKGRKFKIENEKPFSLTYDHTGNNHLEAKQHFGRVKGTRAGSVWDVVDNFDFLDESLMKNIANKQAREVYDDDKGNSFLNPQMDEDKSAAFILELEVALLYDIKEGSIRLVTYEPTTKTTNKYFSSWLQENKLDELVQKFRAKNPNTPSLPRLPKEYIQAVSQNQKEFEQQIAKDPVKALDIAKRSNEQLKYVDLEYFWNNLPTVFEKDEKVFLLIKEYQSGYGKLIQEALQGIKSIFCMIELPSQDELISEVKDLYQKRLDLDNRLFVLVTEEIEQFRALSPSKQVTFKKFDINGFIFPCLEQNEDSINLNGLMQSFATHCLPDLHEQIREKIHEFGSRKELTKERIEAFQDIDKKSSVFKGIDDEEIASIQKTKENFINLLMEKHEDQLLARLKDLKDKLVKQKHSKLEPLQELQEKVKEVKGECFEGYDRIKQPMSLFEQMLTKEIRRIKDEVLAKTYIIDTNVFIEDPEVTFKISQKHYIVLPRTVIGELDKLKRKKELKLQAETAIKILNKSLNKKNKQLKTARTNTKDLPSDFQGNSPDNRILSVAYMYRDKNPILLTSDNGLQLKAKSLEIPTISLVDFHKTLNLTERGTSINYKEVFESTPKTKKGDRRISLFIQTLQEQHPSFDYKKMGFDTATKFVRSLNIFNIKKGFLTLKNQN